MNPMGRARSRSIAVIIIADTIVVPRQILILRIRLLRLGRGRYLWSIRDRVRAPLVEGTCAGNFSMGLARSHIDIGIGIDRRNVISGHLDALKSKINFDFDFDKRLFEPK